uniref:Uncharacterized protein n=1 Tax=Anguilla anguilla TaxID=7936 RepID=A0A0E9X6A3_ANGAN
MSDFIIFLSYIPACSHRDACVYRMMTTGQKRPVSFCRIVFFSVIVRIYISFLVIKQPSHLSIHVHMGTVYSVVPP